MYMKNKRAIITSFLIDRPKQVKLFQIKLPRHAKRVLGVESSIVWKSGEAPVFSTNQPWDLPYPPKRSTLIGEVKLQSTGAANIFYTQELFASASFDFADYTAEWLEEKPCAEDQTCFDSNVEISGEGNVLLGFFADKVHETKTPPYAYKVIVYVWVETSKCS